MKRCSALKEIMTNDVIKLDGRGAESRGDGNLSLYSADFAKSTDPIGNGTSAFVLRSMSKHICVPEWVDKAITKVTTPQEMYFSDKSKHTKMSSCGAFMGLGHGWVVLCILNGWAAWKAGVTPESYRICGDDLIGLWSRESIRRYEQAIVSIGLKLNKAKSFIAKHGVFCERLVKRTGHYEATCQYCVRLGEACGTSSEAKDNLAGCVDGLS